MKFTVFCGALAVVAAMPAQADTAAIQRCRIVAESAARLACYDAIALPGVGSRAGWGAPANATATPPSLPAATPERPGPDGTFGLESRQRDGAADALASRIVGSVTQFENGTRFTLDNGQVWQIVDDTRGVYALENPPVRIERAFLGSFLMTIEGVNQRPRVRRIR